MKDEEAEDFNIWWLSTWANVAKGDWEPVTVDHWKTAGYKLSVLIHNNAYFA